MRMYFDVPVPAEEKEEAALHFHFSGHTKKADDHSFLTWPAERQSLNIKAVCFEARLDVDTEQRPSDASPLSDRWAPRAMFAPRNTTVTVKHLRPL